MIEGRRVKGMDDEADCCKSGTQRRVGGGEGMLKKETWESRSAAIERAHNMW